MFEREDGGSARMHGSETAGDWKDYIEKAQTKSLGRALAAVGYGSQFTDDEFAEGERIVDSPVARGTDKSVKNDKSDGQALHALAAPGSYEQHEAQANGHHDLPTLRELQNRCNRVIGSGMWQTMLHKALKIEDDELVLRDDDLTPGDREHAAAYMDYVEQAKAKKAGAGTGK